MTLSHTNNFTWLKAQHSETSEFPILWLQSSQTDWFPFICPNPAEKLYFSNLGHDYPRTNQPRLSCRVLSNMVVSWEIIGKGGGAATQVSTRWSLFLSISDAIATFHKDYSVILAKTFALWVRYGGESRLEYGVSKSQEISELLYLLLKDEERFTIHMEGSQLCVFMVIAEVEILDGPEKHTRSTALFL